MKIGVMMFVVCLAVLVLTPVVDCMSCLRCDENQVCPSLPCGCEKTRLPCGCCDVCAAGKGSPCSSGRPTCKSKLVCVDKNKKYVEGKIPWYYVEFIGKCKRKTRKMEAYQSEYD